MREGIKFLTRDPSRKRSERHSANWNMSICIDVLFPSDLGIINTKRKSA